jgi:hypothetical protein
MFLSSRRQRAMPALFRALPAVRLQPRGKPGAEAEYFRRAVAGERALAGKQAFQA